MSAQPAPQPETDNAVPLFAARGNLAAVAVEILSLFAATGAVHVTNTGLQSAAELLPLLPDLSFGAQDQFSAGGRTAESHQQKWAAPGLRRLDFYPPQLYLLPNGEIHYQRECPARILFYCETAPVAGGRTFLHAARKVEAGLPRDLLAKLAQFGQTIETGFLDASHPAKKDNYHQSWQERFGSTDRDAALAAAKARSSEYDDAWFIDDAGSTVLMTRVTLPGYVEGCLRFPRIAADAPAARNGFRRFPLGNGVELTDAEKALLKQAYLSTAEGHAWRRGDIILMGNARYAHSREPFEGPREVWLAMAGLIKIPQ